MDICVYCPWIVPHDYAQHQYYDSFSSQMTKVLFYPYLLSWVVFFPQVVHFHKFFNWLFFLLHQVILLHSNFLSVAAFLRMFFSGLSFLLFNFFTLPYSSLYFLVGCFYLLNLFIWIFPPHLVHFVPPSNNSTFNIPSGILYLIFHRNTTSILLPPSYITHMLFLYIVQSVLQNNFCFLGHLQM